MRVRKVCVLLLLSVLVIASAREGFRFAKLHLALKRAHREFSNKQFMRAEFWTGRALSVDENNVDATRLMAEINEVQDKPAALDWRIRVVQREPKSTTDIMALAKSAMRFDQDDMAVDALNGLPADFKNRSAEYHELMAGCTLAAHEAVIAGAHFDKAAELDPGNPVYRVNIEAFLLTNSSSREVRAAAAQKLEAVLTDARVSLYADRALLRDAIRSGDRARAQRFAEMLRSHPEHNFNDDLSCLEAVISEPAFQPALTEIEHRVESDALLAREAGDWLDSHGMAAETLRWFAQLPEAVQSDVRMQMTVAEGYSAMRDWNGLETFLAKCYWDKGEYLRRAMLVRCKRELSQPWEKEWAQLVTEVEANPPDGLLLAQLVTGWKWRDETIDLLWGAATKPMTESRALQYLWGLYSRANDTHNLWRVAREQIALDPASPAKKNNAAFLSLLLYGASERSLRFAREASTTNPKVPEWAATYAYALHLAGKESEAKKVMEDLPSKALERPGIALYYAIVLAANGDDAQAKVILSKLNPTGMLPEEVKLAADLGQQLNGTSH